MIEFIDNMTIEIVEIENRNTHDLVLSSMEINPGAHMRRIFQHASMPFHMSNVVVTMSKNRIILPDPLHTNVPSHIALFNVRKIGKSAL